MRRLFSCGPQDLPQLADGRSAHGFFAAAITALVLALFLTSNRGFADTLLSIDSSAEKYVRRTNQLYFPLHGRCASGRRSLLTATGGAIRVQKTFTCSSDGAWNEPMTLISLPDGVVRITLTQGNLHADASYFKDTKDPSLSITTPDRGIYLGATAARAVRIGGTCSESGKEIDISHSSSGVRPQRHSVGRASCHPDGKWITTLDLSALDDSNSIQIRATHRDAAGNFFFVEHSVGKDSRVPRLSIGSPDAFIYNRNVSAYPVAGDCEHGSTVEIEVGKSPHTSVSCLSGRYGAVLHLERFPDGPLEILARQIDLAGNIGSARYRARKKTELPFLSIDVPPPGAQLSGPRVAIQGECEVDRAPVLISYSHENGVPANLASALCEHGRYRAVGFIDTILSSASSSSRSSSSRSSSPSGAPSRFQPGALLTIRVQHKDEANNIALRSVQVTTAFGVRISDLSSDTTLSDRPSSAKFAPASDAASPALTHRKPPQF